MYIFFYYALSLSISQLYIATQEKLVEYSEIFTLRNIVKITQFLVKNFVFHGKHDKNTENICIFGCSDRCPREERIL